MAIYTVYFTPSIEKLISTVDSIYSKDFLDLFVHNKFAIPNESQLRSFWEQLEPIFNVTLKENGEQKNDD